MRVGGVQALDVAEQHQQVRFNADGHNGGQRIVVAQGGDLCDLSCGNRVVFVDDRNGAQLQQALERRFHVVAAHFVLDVRRREQHLRHGVVVFGKQLVVGVHQLALAHGRGGLLGGHVRGARPELQLAHAHADGARGNQHDLVPGILQVRQCFAQCFHQADVQTSGFVGKRGSAHLYDDSHQKSPQPIHTFPSTGRIYPRAQPCCRVSAQGVPSRGSGGFGVIIA